MNVFSPCFKCCNVARNLSVLVKHFFSHCMLCSVYASRRCGYISSTGKKTIETSELSVNFTRAQTHTHTSLTKYRPVTDTLQLSSPSVLGLCYNVCLYCSVHNTYGLLRNLNINYYQQQNTF